jgi:preprotein translocase subunit YajC
MLFNRNKYFALLIILLVLFFGFLMMSGPENTQTEQFNQKIFSSRRITLAPIIIISAYIGLIFLILKQEKKDVRAK